MIKKLLICPWFGALPPWFVEYEKNIAHLKDLGYDFLIDTDLPAFKKRVADILGIDCPIVPGSGKVHDYRCALGELYQKELEGYEFWGHVDFDCIFGNVDKWVTDEFLSELDIHSNHNTYICGPWTLYRNKSEVNSLFRQSPHWQAIMQHPESTGWVEMEYSRIVENSGLRYAYTFWQADPDHMHLLRMDGTALYEGDREVMMAHFRRTKRWPL
jgi:hypothetical protein